jgi:serine/threonine protein kinase
MTLSDFKERYSYDPAKDLLGAGGFAEVFLATDNLLHRKVALKFFTGGHAEKYSVLAEIRRIISLEHENIIRYYDAVVLEVPGIHGTNQKAEIGVMEYLDGGHLLDYLKSTGASENLKSKLLSDVLKGIQYLHEHGVIHRDLKPQNILIKNTPKGPVAKITDFGISKNTGAANESSSALLGSIEFMAPEQFNPAKYGVNGKISGNVDLWAFGVMAYEVFAGTKLFGARSEGNTSEQVMRNILRDENEIDFSRVPSPWEKIIKRCIVRDAGARAAKADELLENIPATIVSEKILPKPVSPEFKDDKAIIPRPGEKKEEQTEILTGKVSGKSDLTEMLVKGTGAGITGSTKDTIGIKPDEIKKRKPYVLITGVFAVIALVTAVFFYFRWSSKQENVKRISMAIAKSDSLHGILQWDLACNTLIPLLNDLEEDTSGIKIYYKLSNECNFGNHFDSSIAYAKEGLRLAEVLKEEAWQAKLNAQLGRVYYRKAAYNPGYKCDSALVYQTKAVEYYKLNNDQHLPDAYLLLAQIQAQLTDYRAAIDGFLAYQRLTDDAANPVDPYGYTNTGLANCYKELGMLDSACYYYERAISYQLIQGDLHGLATNYYNLCLAEYYLGNPEKSIESGDKALRYGTELAMRDQFLAGIYLTLADAYKTKGMIQKSQECRDSAHTLFTNQATYGDFQTWLNSAD